MNDTELKKQEAIAEKVRTFLRAHTRMVLAINDCAGGPNASVMHYAVGNNIPLDIYFGTCKRYKKYELLEKDRRVSCIFFDEKEDPTRTVSIHGVAREIDPEIETELAKAIFTLNNNTSWYVENKDDIVMYAIRPSSIRYLDSSGDDLKVTTLEEL